MILQPGVSPNFRPFLGNGAIWASRSSAPGRSSPGRWSFQGDLPAKVEMASAASGGLRSGRMIGAACTGSSAISRLRARASLETSTAPLPPSGRIRRPGSEGKRGRARPCSPNPAGRVVDEGTRGRGRRAPRVIWDESAGAETRDSSIDSHPDLLDGATFERPFRGASCPTSPEQIPTRARSWVGRERLVEDLERRLEEPQALDGFGYRRIHRHRLVRLHHGFRRPTSDRAVVVRRLKNPRNCR